MSFRTVALAFILTFSGMEAGAQIFTGSLLDSSEKKPLDKAVVYLLGNNKALLSFGRSDSIGHFSLKSKDGEVRSLMITSPLFADFTLQFDSSKIARDSSILLGTIFMTAKVRLLEQVIVSARKNMLRMKGDTLIYILDSLKLRPNASVEDLLRLLPGLQVDRDGKIRFQGEQVKRVLIDGEEFFPEDPTIATKYLNADIVKEVQLYDSKSRRSELTGFDDGSHEKIINLKIKEGRKKGYFGKIGVSGNPTERYENMGIINSFSGSRQVSLFGHIANTPATELGADYESFDGSTLGDSWTGPLTEGIPSSWSAGARYANRYTAKEGSIEASGMLSHIAIDGNTDDIQKYNLPDSSYSYRANAVFNNRQSKQGVNTRFSLKPDSVSLAKITVKGNLLQTTLAMNRTAATLNADSSVVNTNNQEVSQHDVRRNLAIELYYQKKLNKNGRSFSLNIAPSVEHISTSGLSRSQIRYFNDTGVPEKKDSVDQLSETRKYGGGITTEVFYAEPVSPHALLSFTYNLQVSHTNSSISVYDQNIQTAPVLDSSYSSYFTLTKFNHNASVDYNHRWRRLEWKAGVKLFGLKIDNNDLFSGKYEKTYTNYAPNFYFRWKFSSSRSLTGSYTGIFIQPEISQLQPVKNNADPLNIIVGNDKLQPSFQNTFNMGYGESVLAKKRFFSVKSSAGFIRNDFTSSAFIDSLGRNVTTSTNVDGNYFINGDVAYSKTYKDKYQLQVNANAAHRVFSNFVNGHPNKNNINSLNVEIALSVNLAKLYAGVRINPKYSELTSRNDPAGNSKYWDTRLNIWSGWTLPRQFFLYSDCQFVSNPAILGISSARNFAIWNAIFSKTVLKNNSLELKLKVNDILNQNQGLTRSVSGNAIIQHSYQTLQRYWTLSVTWNFTHNK